LKFCRRHEREHQRRFVSWCLRHQLPLRRDWTHRRTSGEPGWPDFMVVYRNCVLPIEFKATKTGRLSPEQVTVFSHLLNTGTQVHICYSDAEAIELTREWMWVN
jgi:hypothetical protein